MTETAIAEETVEVAEFEPSGRASYDVVRLADPTKENEYLRAKGQIELRKLAAGNPAAEAALDASGSQDVAQWTSTVKTGVGGALIALSGMESLPPGTPADIVKLHAAMKAVRDDAVGE